MSTEAGNDVVATADTYVEIYRCRLPKARLAQRIVRLEPPPTSCFLPGSLQSLCLIRPRPVMLPLPPADSLPECGEV